MTDLQQQVLDLFTQVAAIKNSDELLFLQSIGGTNGGTKTPAKITLELLRKYLTITTGSGGGSVSPEAMEDIMEMIEQTVASERTRNSGLFAPIGTSVVFLSSTKTFAQQVTKANTIYVIQDNFTLTGDVTIPAGCTLEFDGGSISGSYTLTGNNTVINAAPVKIFDTATAFAGTWNTPVAYAEWFADTVNVSAAQKTIDTFYRWDLLPRKNYNISSTIYIRGDYVKIKGNTNTFIYCSLTEGALFQFESDDNLLPGSWGPVQFEISDIFISFLVDSNVVPANRVTCFKTAKKLIDSKFKNIRIYGAYRGFDFTKKQATGSSAWDIYYENVRISRSYIMFELSGWGAIQHLFNRCYFDQPVEGQGVDAGEPGVCIKLEKSTTVSFVDCNFGGEYSSNNRKGMRFLEFGQEVSNVRFSCCNFEEGFCPEYSATDTWKNGLLCFCWNTNNISLNSCTFLFTKYVNRIFQYKETGYETAYTQKKFGRLIHAATGCSLDIRNCKFTMRGNTSMNVESGVRHDIEGIIEDVISDYGNSNIVLDNYSRQLPEGGQIQDYIGRTALVVKEQWGGMQREKACKANDKMMPRRLLYFDSSKKNLSYLYYAPHTESVDGVEKNVLGYYVRTTKLPVYANTTEAMAMVDKAVGDAYFDTTLGKPIYVKSIDASGNVTWVDALGNDPATTYQSEAN